VIVKVLGGDAACRSHILTIISLLLNNSS